MPLGLQCFLLTLIAVCIISVGAQEPPQIAMNLTHDQMRDLYRAERVNPFRKMNITDMMNFRRRLLGHETDETRDNHYVKEYSDEEVETMTRIRRRLLGHQFDNKGEAIVYEETTYLPNHYNPGLYPFGYASFKFGAWDHGYAGPQEDVAELPEHRRLGAHKAAAEAIFLDTHGLVAVGMLEMLIQLTLYAYCPPRFGVVYECPEYEDSRRRLWLSVSAVVCGMKAGAWEEMKYMAVEKSLEMVLGQCDESIEVDIVGVVDFIATVFLFESGLQRPDLVAVIKDNDFRAQRVATQPDDDIDALHPAIYLLIAPIPTGVREPAVVTAGKPADYLAFTPSLETGAPQWADSNIVANEARINPAPFPEHPVPMMSNIPNYEMHVHGMLKEQENYVAQYLSHPSPYSKWAEGVETTPAQRRIQHQEKYAAMRARYCFNENTCQMPVIDYMSGRT